MTELEIIPISDLTIMMEPTEIVKIAVGEITAPVATGTELTKLLIIVKNVFLDLLTHSTRDDESGQLIPHPEALAWEKELRLLIKDVHDLTKGVQDKVMMKKMDLVADLYKQATKGKTPQEIIKTVRELQDGEFGK